MGYVRVAVYVDNILWDYFITSYDRVVFVFKTDQSARFAKGDCEDDEFEIVHSYDLSSNSEGDKVSPKRMIKINISLNGHELSYFAYLLVVSNSYRYHVVNHILDLMKRITKTYNTQQLSIHLHNPPKHIIDKKWNDRISHLVMERSELDNAMSWLSTLGGAYSALGDHFVYCAEMAGRISLQQFRLALRLGDDSTVARCKLYAALSLIQTGRFKVARRLIEEQYCIATSSSSPDIRLMRMCRGVWSKLRYEYSRHRQQRKREIQP